MGIIIFSCFSDTAKPDMARTGKARRRHTTDAQQEMILQRRVARKDWDYR
jgi:hypothetical protein